MAEYIEREAAMKAVTAFFEPVDTVDKAVLLNHLLKKLMLPLAADVAPVVRCKECKHYANVDPYKGMVLNFRWCSKFRNITTVDDFCSYGERRDTDV